MTERISPALDGVPPGTIVAYGGANAPKGWLLCDGSAVSRATYMRLFAAIGTAYGAGDGSTTFNIPNFRTDTGGDPRLPLGINLGDPLMDTLGERWAPAVDQGGDAGQPIGPLVAYIGVNFIVKI